MDWLRIISDIHGNWRTHLRIAQGCEYSIQLGDLGFNYDYLSVLDPQRHRWIGGNHDNYDIISENQHNLGDFGTWSVPDFGDIFFIRGGFSIDAKYRNHFGPRKSWWAEEELSYEQLSKAIDLYQEIKPLIVVSHECPLNIVRHVTNPRVALSFGFPEPIIKTRTNQALQAMVEIHTPRFWVFGHFHKDFNCWIDPTGNHVLPAHDQKSPDEIHGFTQYICMEECKSISLSKDFLTKSV